MKIYCGKHLEYFKECCQENEAFPELVFHGGCYSVNELMVIIGSPFYFIPFRYVGWGRLQDGLIFPPELSIQEAIHAEDDTKRSIHFHSSNPRPTTEEVIDELNQLQHPALDFILFHLDLFDPKNYQNR